MSSHHLKVNVRENMFRELKEKAIFDQVSMYALEYLDEIFDRNVYPTEDALAEMVVFEEQLPEAGTDPKEILHKLHRYGSPATVAHSGGRYFGFVNGGVLPTALAAKWLSDSWDQNTALYVLSPIASKLECVVEGWLRQLFGLPDSTVAGFVISALPMAILGGLAAARSGIQRHHWDVNARGLSMLRRSESLPAGRYMVQC